MSDDVWKFVRHRWRERVWPGGVLSVTINTLDGGTQLRLLLQLLYDARLRARTLRIESRRTLRQARLDELLRLRGLLQEPPRIPAEERLAGGPGPWRVPHVLTSRTTLWAAAPDWLRWEATHEADDGSDFGSEVGIKQGELYWTRHGFDEGRVQTNEDEQHPSSVSVPEELLLDPAPLLGGLIFETIESGERLGRRVLRVQATSRPSAPQIQLALHPFADRWDLEADGESGVLLNLASSIGDEEITRIEVESITFDEAIDGALFQPPP
jgi:hypothetical protein